ncbi:MAG TPA: cyclodeaminase/cyclohydrolase family protein [Streptosporangiaceae bacterium]
MSSEDSYAGLSVGAFLDALAAGAPAPAGGSAAALVLAQAAALCAKSARLSGRQLTASRAAELTAEAEQIRATAASLIDEDPRAYQAVIEQSRRIGERRAERSAARRSDGMAAALSAAADVPMRIVELATSVAALAAVLARDGKPALRGDAIAAGLLARAAARAAAALVSINLADRPADPRHSRADSLLAAIDEQLLPVSGGGDGHLPPSRRRPTRAAR